MSVQAKAATGFLNVKVILDGPKLKVENKIHNIYPS